jgi:ankyrin
VKSLLEHGANVNAAANDGSTVLMMAVSAGDAEIVRELLTKGADPSAKFTQTGKTPLMVAKEKDFTDIVRTLEAAAA